jgi:uncharacterized protein YegP (UPF0339 family)
VTESESAEAVERELRNIEIRKAKGPGFWYRVTAANNEVVYHSETFPEQNKAIKAARREHEGRTKFTYVLSYVDRSGKQVEETL